ncbi:MAG: transposase [Acidimicrobiales bacterium]|nr:transposase [Acidimicrobiales bacterium]
MTDRKKYSREFRDDAVGLVVSSVRPVAQVCVDIGVNEGTLGNWVRKYQAENPERFSGPEREAVPWEEHQRTLAEVAKLKAEIEFLGKVSAFFAAKQP